MSVSVVIPIWTVTERLATCLEALAAQTFAPRETIVVLSRGGIVDGERLHTRWPHVHVRHAPQPATFCRAVNHGIAATNTSWVLVLNDDVILAPDFFEQLLTAMPSDERIGMVCGKIFSGDGRRIDAAGQCLTRARTAHDRGHRSTHLERFNTPDFVFCAPGSAALYRRRMLDALAADGRYFDEQLGFYLEDLDLGWRAQQAGWFAYYVPHATARHLRGATAKTRVPKWPWLRRYYLPHLRPKLQVRYILNRYRLIAKHDTWRSLLRHLPWIAWYELKLWSYLFLCEPKTLRLLRRVLRPHRAASAWSVAHDARTAVL